MTILVCSFVLSLGCLVHSIGFTGRSFILHCSLESVPWIRKRKNKLKFHLLIHTYKFIIELHET